MAQLIKHGIATTDSWRILELAEGESPETVALPDGDIIFPLAVGHPHRIAKIEIIFIGQPVLQCFQNGKTTDARIDDANGSIVVHLFTSFQIDHGRLFLFPHSYHR